MDKMPTPQQIELTRKTLAVLFSETPDAELDGLLSHARLRSFEEGEVLVSEGDEAQEVFVLCEGRIRVFARNQEGHWSGVATIHERGSLIGEQAFAQRRKYRNATLIALTSGQAVEIPGTRFRAALENNATASRIIAAKGNAQLKQRLQSIARELAELDRTTSAPNVRQLAPGEILFEAGTSARHAYLIIAGELALNRVGSQQTNETAGPGLPLGVEEALEGSAHTQTCRAITVSEVLEIEYDHLVALNRERSGLRNILSGWSRIKNLPHAGIARRFIASEQGQTCLITDFREENGVHVRIRHFPSRAFTEAVRRDPGQQETILLNAADGQTTLMCTKEDYRLTGIAGPVGWSGLPDAIGMLLRGGALTRLQLDAFTASGRLLIEDPSFRASGGSTVVCACTLTTSRDLRNAARECDTVEQLMQLTGAGTICGGCRNRLPAFLGKDDAILCQLITTPLATGSLKATLRALPPSVLPVPKTGQHINVEALIDGHWVGRPYTLTGWSDQHYELGVKIEERGFFSNWLNRAEQGMLVRISAPEGEVCPASGDPRPLIYIVAGIGVTPAVSGARYLAGKRVMQVFYSYRTAEHAPYLQHLRDAADRGHLRLHEHATATLGRLDPDTLCREIIFEQPCQVIICGPESFNQQMAAALKDLPHVEVCLESFDHPQRGEGPAPLPKSWRVKDFQPRCPIEHLPQVDHPASPAEEARFFIEDFYATEHPGEGAHQRVEQAVEQLNATGAWTMTFDELCYAAKLAWRNAERCIGRLYWQGLHLRDCRHLKEPADIAQALFEHLRFAFNGGDLRPAISVFNPGTRETPGPRIWNPQLLRYAGQRLRSGKQVGDPAQNEITRRIMALGWEPAGTDFDLLPLVIQFPGCDPQWFELPADCREEVAIMHPHYPWLENMKLRWYTVPAVSDMALDAGGMKYTFAPFNGWYLNTEIAARNLTDTNRYNLLPRLAEQMGLDISDDRTLWRDKALIMINDALIRSFDRAGVKISDHHNACHEFLEFCRVEQKAGREPCGDWTWLVPPVSSSTTALYQEPFINRQLKPAYVAQSPVWK